MMDRRNRHDLPTVREIDRLVSRVVSEVRLGDAKRDEALVHYKNAGEALIELKAACKHGEFEPLKVEISSILDISRSRIGQLMKLAREWPVSWDRWQEICGNKPKEAPGEPLRNSLKPPTPDARDLSHAMKLIALRDRGANADPRLPAGLPFGHLRKRISPAKIAAYGRVWAEACLLVGRTSVRAGFGLRPAGLGPAEFMDASLGRRASEIP
ncbi:MAG: hypothetical protein NXI12_03815 [Alphaproteobacteria bacterium]|nr:hypothetical protein [Alphaproteobacteria bacterium]